MNKDYNSIDLFSGIGGLSTGLSGAGFKIKCSVELDKHAVNGYKLNHPKTKIFDKDIRKIDTNEIKKLLKGEQLHLLAGCPPCQGFSSVRRLNRKQNVRDERNSLVLEFLRFVKELNPLTIMMENVPGLVHYYLFKKMVNELVELGYFIDYKIVNVKEYGVPQSRRRLVLVGSLLGEIKVAEGGFEGKTVRDAIEELLSPSESEDPLHQIFPNHTKRIKDMITMIPKDGGSRKDLPEEYILDCHKKENVGFNDVYGRLSWDHVSSTITGGCLNPSKGRFLHPEEDRCISAREASLLQTFPKDYKFPLDVPKSALALLIGNALPPKFSQIQSKSIKTHLDSHLIKD